MYLAFIKEYEAALFEVNWLTRGRKRIPGVLERKISVELPALYRDALPVYELAVCPLCGGTVQEAVDTFSLAGIGWRNEGPLGFGWYGRIRPNPRSAKFALQADGWPLPSYQAACDHVQGMTYGVHLNGIYPNDTRVPFVEIGEGQPGVLRPFIEHEGCTTVLRTLPVSRRDDDEWQPRYTAWFLTYFSPTPTPFRASLPQVDMERDAFYWPYHLLTHELTSLVAAGKVTEMPDNSVPLDKLRGLNGRWAITSSRLRLIPEKLWGRSLTDRRHPAFFNIEDEEEKLLTGHTLESAPVFLQRLAKRLTQFVQQTPDWQTKLPFETSDTFMHPLHHGFVWSLSLRAEAGKVRLNFHMNRSHQKNRITRQIFLGTAVELTESLPQITAKIEALADPEGLRIMYQTLVDYAPAT